MQKIGTIKYLQIQTEPLKQIQNPDNSDDRIYHTSSILRIAKLELTEQGIIGIDAEGNKITDVHNETHPQTRYRGDNKISFGFIQQYDRMQERFGNHIEVGNAGENILIDAEVDILRFDKSRRFFIKQGDATIELNQVIPAPPCRPFSIFCANEDLHGKDLKEALQFLDNGTRGYYANLLSDEPQTVEVGAELWAQ